MQWLSVDPNKCNKDGICAAECPSAVIEMSGPDGYPAPTADASAHCLFCGHCVAVCPEAALSLKWLDPGACPPVDPALHISTRQAAQFLRSRRSIRTFRDQPVEREKLWKLIETACYAPSAKNMQPWHWVVVEDPGQVRRLAALVMEWIRMVINQAPEIAAERGLPRVVEQWDRGEERICRGAPHVILVHGDKEWPFGTQDCTLALSHLDLFAPTLGLGTCWGGYLYTAVNNYPPLRDTLSIPPAHQAYGAMMVGYPRFRYHRLPLRKPPDVTWI